MLELIVLMILKLLKDEILFSKDFGNSISPFKVVLTLIVLNFPDYFFSRKLIDRTEVQNCSREQSFIIEDILFFISSLS